MSQEEQGILVNYEVPRNPLLAALARNYLKEHPEWLQTAKERDPALKKYDYLTHDAIVDILDKEGAKAGKKLEILAYPGLTALAAHEEARKYYDKAKGLGDTAEALSAYATARNISEAASTETGMDIHPGATIAIDFFVDHCKATIIGETAIVGNGCFSLHGVTLGGSDKEVEDARVTGGKRRHPALGNHVTIGSNVGIYGPCDIGDNVVINTGATIIDCTIGEGAKIGAGVHLRGVTIPPGATVYEMGTPKVVIYSKEAEHQGKIVTARNQSRTQIELAEGNSIKEAITSEFITPEQAVALRHSGFAERISTHQGREIAVIH